MQRESIQALKKIKIRDNGEPLVDLKKICPQIIIGLEKRRLKKEKSVFPRKTVARMLKNAQKFLPTDYKFKILDAWRPFKEQKRYYFNFYRRLKKKHPQWSKAQLRKETNKWVFPPDAGTPPWHTTGGAIDLTICYPNGRSILINSKKKKLPAIIFKNRKLLKEIMEKSGFTNYLFEWWHFSYGDTGWALRTGKKVAVYGTVDIENSKL